jgi:hypothetical protein
VEVRNKGNNLRGEQEALKPLVLEVQVRLVNQAREWDRPRGTSASSSEGGLFLRLYGPRLIPLFLSFRMPSLHVEARFDRRHRWQGLPSSHFLQAEAQFVHWTAIKRVSKTNRGHLDDTYSHFNLLAFWFAYNCGLRGSWVREWRRCACD